MFLGSFPRDGKTPILYSAGTKVAAHFLTISQMCSSVSDISFNPISIILAFSVSLPPNNKSTIFSIVQ